MSNTKGITTAIRNHPVASLVAGAFTVYAGYWAVMQMHWLVSHAFTILLFAALVAGVTVVTRKVKSKGKAKQDPMSTIDWDAAVRAYQLPEAAPKMTSNTLFDAVKIQR